MLTAVLLVVLILGLGAHLSDGVRLKQEEAILRKLPVDEAHGYYEILRRRARRVRLLRAITLASLVLALLAARRRFFPPPAAATPWPRPRRRPTHTAGRPRRWPTPPWPATRRAAGWTPRAFEPPGVSGDDQHPWIFEYRAQPGTRAAAAGAPRIYVDRAGPHRGAPDRDDARSQVVGFSRSPLARVTPRAEAIRARGGRRGRRPGARRRRSRAGAGPRPRRVVDDRLDLPVLGGGRSASADPAAPAAAPEVQAAVVPSSHITKRGTGERSTSISSWFMRVRRRWHQSRVSLAPMPKALSRPGPSFHSAGTWTRKTAVVRSRLSGGLRPSSVL